MGDLERTQEHTGHQRMGVVAVEVDHVAHGENIQLLVTGATLYEQSVRERGHFAIRRLTVALMGNRTGQVIRQPTKQTMMSSLK